MLKWNTLNGTRSAPLFGEPQSNQCSGVHCKSTKLWNPSFFGNDGVLSEGHVNCSKPNELGYSQESPETEIYRGFGAALAQNCWGIKAHFPCVASDAQCYGYGAQFPLLCSGSFQKGTIFC